VVEATLPTLLPGKELWKTLVHTGGWVGSRVGPDSYGKSSPNRASIPGPSVSEDNVMVVGYHESLCHQWILDIRISPLTSKGYGLSDPDVVNE
jgi:hypothetical protein